MKDVKSIEKMPGVNLKRINLLAVTLILSVLAYGFLFISFRSVRNFFPKPSMGGAEAIGFAQYFGYPLYFDTFLFFAIIFIPVTIYIIVRIKIYDK